MNRKLDEERSFTRILTRFVVNTAYQDLPQVVVSAAKLAILDHIGVVLAGSREPIATIINEFIQGNKSRSEATIIGGGYKSSCSLAALANGTFGHALDYDDCLDFPTRGLGHPSTAILPAAIAIGEKLNASGKDLITAYCSAMEVYGKVGLLLGEAFHSRSGWVRTSVLGVIGAGAVASKLLGLDEYQVSQCFGIAASFAGGLQRNFGTMVNPLHSGNAARNGLEAALLAAKGFTSWDGIFEAPSGFYNVFSQTQDKAPERAQEELLGSLGNPWNIVSPGLMFKVYPCAHIAHFCVDAALYFRREYSVDWQQIAEVELRVPFRSGSSTTYPQPQTGLEGKFSLEYCMSRALIDGRVRILDFTDEKVKEPSVKLLMDKMKRVPYPVEKPDPFAPQEFTVKLVDGRSYNCRIVHPRGEPQNPAKPEEVITKYQDCAVYALSDEKLSSRIESLVLNLENVANISQIARLLRGSVS